LNFSGGSQNGLYVGQAWITPLTNVIWKNLFSESFSAFLGICRHFQELKGTEMLPEAVQMISLVPVS